ncbi:MAG: diaminopimelate dehydrogenase [Firmicutes bacterium]|nr:diaminopimelate dehydrogenase [Bacillota bacterium]
MKKIRLAIAGYGNLGRATIANLSNFDDFELVGIFSRRKLDIGYPAYSYEDAKKLKGKIDVVLMCGGSAKDLPVQSPEMAANFCIVDSFDTHADIPKHFENVNTAAKKAKTLAAVAVGWDPGLFSLNRVMFDSILPKGADYTFWGKGVSQGHSDAIRKIDGVLRATQYTIPKEEAIAKIKEKGIPALTTREKHLRECFVVAKEDADKAKIEKEIVTMPNYFADYDTVVYFISEDEWQKNHSALPHGGFVLRKGNTSKENEMLLEFSIKLDSNPEFTSAVCLSYARAVVRMFKEGVTGCVTAFDVPIGYLSKHGNEVLRAKFL